MQGTLTIDGSAAPATEEAVTRAIDGGGFFWLDLRVPGPEPDPELRRLLTDRFHFHPIAVDAADHFSQRPRIDEFEDFVHVVTFGMATDGKKVVEVHCFLTQHCIISIHQDECSALDAVRANIGLHHSSDAAAPQVVIFYLILDGLVDSFFPALSVFDDQIDELEAAILKDPTEDQLGTLFDMKRQIIMIRKVIAPQRDMIATLSSGMVTLPGMTDKGTVYFRSLYDHLIRISDLVDGYRDLVSGAMDTHLSMVSNRLNVVMKQLAIIATIFMPLGYLTGFFGQNFAWGLVHLESNGFDYFVFGIVPELVAIAAMLWLFKRRGWLGGPTA